MIDYDQLEDSIVAKLTPLNAGDVMTLIKLPENQNIPMAVVKPRVIVSYRESKYESTQPNDGTMQEEKAYFNIEVSAPLLRGSKGARVILQAVKALLQGKYATRPDGKKIGSAISFEISGFPEIPYKDGIWTIIVSCFIKVINVMTDETETEQLIRRITVNTDPATSGNINDTYVVPDDINP